MDRRIAAAKAALGNKLVILGHHYQRDEVIKFAADYTGDSYKLSQQVAKHPEGNTSCSAGVYFMAESADVLSADHQRVILPDSQQVARWPTWPIPINP